LGVSYNAVRERIAADGARLVEADDQRPDEGPLEGWERFDITPEQWKVIHPRVKEVLVDQGLEQQGVRFGFNLNKDKTLQPQQGQDQVLGDHPPRRVGPHPPAGPGPPPGPRLLTPAAAAARNRPQDNDDVEWQAGRVYLHLGARRDASS
jgi:hypothetical protein